jgi:hypothetical protein
VKRRDWLALGAVALLVALLLLYRAVYVEPRAWGAACAAAAPPLACAPRAALLWLQQHYLWGAGALALGLWAFAGGRWGRRGAAGGPFLVAVAAVVLGIAAVINYNATWGMAGAALGAWCWIRRDALRGASPPSGT